jgi:hypothetical protein
VVAGLTVLAGLAAAAWIGIQSYQAEPVDADQLQYELEQMTEQE